MTADHQTQSLTKLLSDIRACRLCQAQLVPRPVIQASVDARLLIIGQAPGSKVHQTGVPWDDASGKRLRQWLGISEQIFYDPHCVAIVPCAFCYPGKGTQGDLPPPVVCYEQWHTAIMASLTKVEMTLLVGRYAQARYLVRSTQSNLTENVANYSEHSMKGYWPLPHPSPRNRHWLRNNPWFEQRLLPELQQAVRRIFSDDGISSSNNLT
ncbi:uracil-DNA glycosylase family protein [Agarivorans sp. QJM3NY_25]|uniref:uracil-DNA glycosylase family protein n=1 Tax=Agarivorans sp. QJM3NY_25 TaxID=3421430 RepID=UPI003D7E2DB9